MACDDDDDNDNDNDDDDDNNNKHMIEQQESYSWQNACIIHAEEFSVERLYISLSSSITFSEMYTDEDMKALFLELLSCHHHGVTCITFLALQLCSTASLKIQMQDNIVSLDLTSKLPTTRLENYNWHPHSNISFLQISCKYPRKSSTMLL